MGKDSPKQRHFERQDALRMGVIFLHVVVDQDQEHKLNGFIPLLKKVDCNFDGSATIWKCSSLVTGRCDTGTFADLSCLVAKNYDN